MASRPAFRSSRSLALVLLLSSAGCVPAELQALYDQAKRELNAVAVVLQGGRNPLTQPSPSPSPSGAPEGEFSSEAAMRSKANGELLAEMYKVVFVREPRDKTFFASYVDSLNQGASLEGVYNGFTHSSDYRTLEVANPGASPEAIRIFGEELAILEAALPVITEFDEKSALPLARPVDVGGGDLPVVAPSPVTEMTFGGSAPASPKPVDVKALGDKYAKLFVGASIYTLKRVLGDETLKVVASKLEFRERLSSWYAEWVVRLAGRNVDFGLPLRNRPDAQFHWSWAAAASEDRLVWEMLNRVHRLMNEANRQKQ